VHGFLTRIWDVDIIEVDFATISVKEQILIMSKTDILIGIHGAAMTNLLFLPPTATIIEYVLGDGFMVNNHFRDFAKWTGRSYIQLRGVVCR